MWTCTACRREFKRKNQSHYCKSVNTIDAYIALFSQEEQWQLHELRKIIKNIAPHSEEKISWEMPTFFQNGNLIHFALHKNHLGLYVGSTTVKAFENELSNFQCDKGTIQLPKDQVLPQALIERMVQFNIKKNLTK